MAQRKPWLLAVLLLAAASVFAQASAEGIWRVEFVSPQGQVAITMTISQTGSKLTGRVTDEYGEWPIEGRITDNQVTVVWASPGKIVACAVFLPRLIRQSTVGSVGVIITRSSGCRSIQAWRSRGRA